MTQHSYHERDYAFGQVMFKLRTSIGLTQAGLAHLLGVSRRAIGVLLSLLTRPSVPLSSVEEDGGAAVVKASPAPVQLSQRPEAPVAHAGAKATALSRVDWVGALDVSHFAAGEVEVAELSQWIVQERCRLVTLLGMGGISKSTLASYLGEHLAPQPSASARSAPLRSAARGGSAGTRRCCAGH